MWHEALLYSAQSITYALVCRSVLPSTAMPFEKISAALAVRAALSSKHAEQALLFIVPGLTRRTASTIAAGVLVGNFSHAHAGHNVPPEENRPLFRGDLLFVTSSVTTAIAELRDLRITSSQRLTDLWDVVPLTRYTGSRSLRPRVYVANPGWSLQYIKGRRFGAVIIDGSHPRTFAQLPSLVLGAASCSSMRVVVTHPVDEVTLHNCGYPSKLSTWFWDPEAIEAAKVVAEAPVGRAQEPRVRRLILCDGDQELDQAFKALQNAISDVLQNSKGGAYPGMGNIRFLLNAFRQLSVPLTQLEEVASKTWSGGLRRRVEQLSAVSGFGHVVWELTWNDLRAAVDAVYRLLLSRSEPAKFWTLAAHLSELLDGPCEAVRVVVGSRSEAQILSMLLSDLLDRAPSATADGRLLVCTALEEERLVADGWTADTVLMGPRAARFRYLDVFSGKPIDEVVYPFEIETSQRIQERLYAAAAHHQVEESRLALLKAYGFLPPPGSPAQRASPIPTPRIVDGKGQEVRRTVPSDVRSALDLDQLIDFVGAADFDSDGGGERSASSEDAEVVEVTFATGLRQRYYNGQKVDVFFQASGIIERKHASELRAGWHIINFVDDRYASLFDRLQEAILARLPVPDRVALELWQKAKANLLATTGTRRELYAGLVSDGLNSTYEAFSSWFKHGEDETLAPQQFDEFALVARATKSFSSDALIQRTFRCVQHQRGRNRAAGRALAALLRATISGDGYEDALESARRIDPDLADVLAAVETLEVQSVSTTKSRQ